MSQGKQATRYHDPLFGLVLPEHGWVPAPRYLLRRRRIIENLAAMPKSSRILEIGCGTGALLEDLRQIGFSCSAVEISNDALDIAREVHADHPDVKIDSQFPPHSAESFDIIISCEVIEHIENDVEALNDWARHLKKGGLMVISTPANPKKFNALDEWAGHYRRYTKTSLASVCRRADLEPEKFEFYGYPLVELTEVIRGWLCRRQIRKRQRDREVEGMQDATEKSGVDRGIESRLFPLLASPVGRLIYRQLEKLQNRYLDREVGNGLLCFARKR